MATVCNTSEGVENWFIQLSTNPWSFLSIVGLAWSYPEDCLVEARDMKEGEVKSSSIAFSVRLEHKYVSMGTFGNLQEF